jgi:carlactone synthase/all-trans-10'-apo-beta-carotenal 13,14-cleaving dioxygenase
MCRTGRGCGTWATTKSSSCLTETTKSSSVLIDPDTLNTVGKFRYADKLGGMMIQSAVTNRYVVLPEMPLRYSASSLLRSELAPYYAFDCLPASPFMAIHCINAYEDDVDGAAVIVDC